VARDVVLAVAAGDLPAALLQRLCGAALLAGCEAAEVGAVLSGGPHTTARALQLAGRLLMLTAEDAEQHIG
jgi:hypothetical protein